MFYKNDWLELRCRCFIESAFIQDHYLTFQSILKVEHDSRQHPRRLSSSSGRNLYLSKEVHR